MESMKGEEKSFLEIEMRTNAEVFRITLFIRIQVFNPKNPSATCTIKILTSQPFITYWRRNWPI